MADTVLRPVYVETERNGTFEVRLDVPYRDDAEADPIKHRLDLYLPHEGPFPMLAYVHGGSFESGDKAVSIAGLDIYRNVGRFYASRGIGVALINYRLQPEVRWPSQVDDVARAVAWLGRNLTELGGDRLVLSGHSAGAWLAGRVLLDRDQLERPGLEFGRIAGLISISGSGYELWDERTWDLLGGDKAERLWQEKFDSGREGVDWHVESSLNTLVAQREIADVPPILLVYTSKEFPALQRQNQLFYQALTARGARAQLEVVHTDSHRRMALALSHPKRRLSQMVVDFVQGTACTQQPIGTLASLTRDLTAGDRAAANEPEVSVLAGTYCSR